MLVEDIVLASKIRVGIISKLELLRESLEFSVFRISRTEMITTFSTRD